MVALRDIAATFSGLHVGPEPDVPASSGGERLLGARHLSPLAAPADLTRIPFQPGYERYRLQADDVVVASRGVFRVAVLPSTHDGVLLGHNLVAIRTTSLLPTVLAAYLQTPHAQAELFRATRGAVTSGFTLRTLGDLRITLPPLDQQRTLSEIIVRIAAHRGEAQRAIDLNAEAGSLIVEDALRP